MTDTVRVSRDRARRRRGRSDEPADDQESAIGPDGSDGDDASGSPTRSGRSRWGTIIFTLATLIFIGGLGVLLWEGYNSATEVRGGNDLDQLSDPSQPGYQATVKPTQVDLVGMLTPEGTLGDVVMLVEGAGGQGGAVVLIPGVMIVESIAGPLNLETIYETSGWEAVVDTVEQTLGVGVTGATTISTDEFQSVLATHGPLTIDNPDRIVRDAGDGNRETVFAAGQLTLSPEEVVGYVNSVSAGESEVNRAARAQIVWEAWLAGITAQGPDALPDVEPFGGEVGEPVDLRTLMAAMTEGFVSFEQIPLERVPVPGSDGFAVYRPQPDGINEMVIRVVPFPTAAFPGQRPRVRLLNGTTSQDRALRAASPIVAAGGEITALGNADEFGLTATVVEYFDPAFAETAQAIASALGTTATQVDQAGDAFEVTVIVGSDFTG